MTRSANGYLGGVCEGLGRHFGISPTLARIFWIAAVLFMGTGILLYLALWWIIPHEDNVPAEPLIWRRQANGERAIPLQRTSRDRKLLGVCGGIARWWEIDPSVVRLAVLSLAVLSVGLVAVAYLIAALIIPGPDTAIGDQPIEL
jgi:phage shock protein PspC (stress-responsive transcriptional regulator)